MDDSEKRDPNRERDGRFKTGNPGGGRRAMPPEVRAILEAATPKAAQRLVEGLDAVSYTMGGDEYPNYKERREYLCALYDRLYGKPTQAISGVDDEPLFPSSDTANDAARELSRRLLDLLTKTK